MSKFRYTVTPVGVIRLESLGNVGIRSPKTLDLTLDEVKVCLKKGKVYRRFNGTLIKKVTLSNCERLHNEEFIEEKDYKDFLVSEKSKDRGTVKEAEENKKIAEDTVKNLDNITKEYVDKKAEEFKNESLKAEKEVEEEVPETVEVNKEEAKVEEPEVQNNVNNEQPKDNSKPTINANKNNRKHK